MTALAPLTAPSRASVLCFLVGSMLLVSCGLHCAAASSVPETEDQFVYGLTVWDGLTYTSGLSPQRIDEIHIIADSDNILAPYDTRAYFWPITGEYVADWSSKQILVEGVLEVIRDGRVVETIALETYTLRYPEGFNSPNVEVLTGDRALAAHAEYRQAVSDFNEAADRYRQALAEYNSTVAEMFRQMREEGKTFAKEEIPTPPTEPEPPSYYVQSVRKAFVVNLPGGQYTIRVRQNDRIVPGSTKKLYVFEPRRSGLSFVVRPEDSYTVSLRSDSEEHTLYLAKDIPLYIQLFDVEEYSCYHYTRLMNSANPTAGLGMQNEYVWVISSPQRSDLRIRVYRGNRIVSEIDERPYQVVQTQSSALGYTIVEWDPTATEMMGAKPTFSAFRLHVPPGEYRLQAVFSSGEPISGGGRALRGVRRIGHFWWTALVPLFLGLGVYTVRRYSIGTLQSAATRLPEDS
jgi:hypothetical protein